MGESWEGDTKCINVPPPRSSEVEGGRGCSLRHGGAPAVSSLGTPEDWALPEAARWGDLQHRGQRGQAGELGSLALCPAQLPQPSPAVRTLPVGDLEPTG